MEPEEQTQMEPEEREDYSFIATRPEDGYWDWRLDEQREIMSPQFWHMLGYEPEEMAHHGAWRELVHCVDLALIDLNLRMHIKTCGDFPFLQEVRYRHKKGHEVWIRCHGHIAECDENYKPTRIVGTHVDVTDEYTGTGHFKPRTDSSLRGMELAKLYTDYARLRDYARRREDTANQRPCR